MDEHERTRNIASVRIYLVMARLWQGRVKRMDDILRLPVSTRNVRDYAWSQRRALMSRARSMRCYARTLLCRMIDRPAELDRLDGQWYPDPALEPIRLEGLNWVNWEETRIVGAIWGDMPNG